jgi:hypothetical protein
MRQFLSVLDPRDTSYTNDSATVCRPVTWMVHIHIFIIVHKCFHIMFIISINKSTQKQNSDIMIKPFHGSQALHETEHQKFFLIILHHLLEQKRCWVLTVTPENWKWGLNQVLMLMTERVQLYGKTDILTEQLQLAYTAEKQFKKKKIWFWSTKSISFKQSCNLS